MTETNRLDDQLVLWALNEELGNNDVPFYEQRAEIEEEEEDEEDELNIMLYD